MEPNTPSSYSAEFKKARRVLRSRFKNAALRVLKYIPATQILTVEDIPNILRDQGTDLAEKVSTKLLQDI